MTQRWEDARLTAYAVEKFIEIDVDELMTRDILFVRPETPVATVAKTMIDQRVHRLLVLDEENHLLGLITATDFVRLAAKGLGRTKAPTRPRPK